MVKGGQMQFKKRKAFYIGLTKVARWFILIPNSQFG
jgi:hypothetical protein